MFLKEEKDGRRFWREVRKKREKGKALGGTRVGRKHCESEGQARTVRGARYLHGYLLAKTLPRDDDAPQSDPSARHRVRGGMVQALNSDNLQPAVSHGDALIWP
ncbi:hypothetical protein JG32_11805 [Salmonella enterica subsp. enterica serovar Bareilly str. CFSAN000227]|nr:hypothetical protein JG32_11805 [Salmonella enterica subsp. enterica serovar Bareilly str. CFSAN000227]